MGSLLLMKTGGTAKARVCFDRKIDKKKRFVSDIERREDIRNYCIVPICADRLV